MSSEQEFDAGSNVGEDRAPGAKAARERTLGQEVGGYVLGLALAVGLTAASFWVRGTALVYGPGLAMALPGLPDHAQVARAPPRSYSALFAAHPQRREGFHHARGDRATLRAASRTLRD